MSEIVTHNQKKAMQKENSRVGIWIAEIASRIPYGQLPDGKSFKEYLCETVLDLRKQDYPTEAFTASSRNFMVRRFKFFPSFAELCDGIEEYIAPIMADRAAYGTTESDKDDPTLPKWATGCRNLRDKGYAKKLQRDIDNDFEDWMMNAGGNRRLARFRCFQFVEAQCWQVWEMYQNSR